MARRAEQSLGDAAPFSHENVQGCVGTFRQSQTDDFSHKKNSLRRHQPVLQAGEMFCEKKRSGIRRKLATTIDWDAETVTCPLGCTSSNWTPVQEANTSLIKVTFSISNCRVCLSRTLCTGTTRRSMTLHPKEQMQALCAARAREHTAAFKETYRLEGVHSQGVCAMGLRRSRSIGFRKTHLAHVAVAAAMNLVQLTHWLRGEAPEQTRLSSFKQVIKPGSSSRGHEIDRDRTIR